MHSLQPSAMTAEFCQLYPYANKCAEIVRKEHRWNLRFAFLHNAVLPYDHRDMLRLSFICTIFSLKFAFTFLFVKPRWRTVYFKKTNLESAVPWATNIDTDFCNNNTGWRPKAVEFTFSESPFPGQALERNFTWDRKERFLFSNSCWGCRSHRFVMLMFSASVDLTHI